MKVEETPNKVKIILEYPKKVIDFGSIYEKDLSKLYLKVFLKSGNVITAEEIKTITFSIKENQEHTQNVRKAK